MQPKQRGRTHLWSRQTAQTRGTAAALTASPGVMRKVAEPFGARAEQQTVLSKNVLLAGTRREPQSGVVTHR